ncbi:hypothetical protein GQ53DRAFT_521553 [Thozetella sp. PMI_491]|nr:hypothetical protein GQ53DRAFT_521553 [Thozetella sp. PMI_491]
MNMAPVQMLANLPIRSHVLISIKQEGTTLRNYILIISIQRYPDMTVPPQPANSTEPSRGITTSLRSFRYAWNPIFMERRREIHLEQENGSYYEEERIREDGDDVISVFVRILDDFKQCPDQGDTLRNFCEGITLTKLHQMADHPVPDKPLALMFDRDIEKGRTSDLRALTAKALFAELKLPRFTIGLTPANGPTYVNAEQRIIFLLDPNSTALCALAATSSIQQALLLLNFMSSYLAWEPVLAIQTPVGSLSSYMDD